MESIRAFLRLTELNRTTLPELRELVLGHEPEEIRARSYPGYPATPLPAGTNEPLSLEASLLSRRCVRRLSRKLPPAETLGRLLRLAHGVTAVGDRGPVPSAGGLQALELYVAVPGEGEGETYVAPGAYHYDRRGHLLSLVSAKATRERWLELVPSARDVDGGSLVWTIVADAARVERKYGTRGGRMLLLEAGHLMQNLCLVSTALGLSTVPCGGFMESEIARELGLPRGDEILYVGVAGVV